MAIITDQSSLFNLTTLLPWTGQFAGSQGSQDFAPFFATATSNYVSTGQVVDYNTNAPLTYGFNTYYKIQGFNTATNKYEVWHSMGTPLLQPPSGHTLSNITVIATWTDR